VVDFFRLHRITDVGDLGFAGNGPIGIRNQFVVFIEEGEEGQAVASGAQLILEFRPAGCVEASLVAALLHVDAGDHEMPRKDGPDVGSLDKPIEALAPPSPGSTEQKEDVFVLCGGLRLGAIEHLLRGRRPRRRHSQSGGEQDQRGRSQECVHGRNSRVWARYMSI